MEIDQFTMDIEKYIYQNISKEINMIMGLDKISQLSLGLFLKCPIVIRVSEVDIKELNPINLNKDLDYIFSRFGAYVEFDDVISIYFTFMVDKEKVQEELKMLYDKILKLQSTALFSFIYLHELQHMLRGHNTVMYNNMMKSIFNKYCPEENKDTYIKTGVESIFNIAEDYAINYSLIELFESSNLKHEVSIILNFGLHDEKYSTDKLNEQEILIELLKQRLEVYSETISSYNDSGEMNKITIYDNETGNVIQSYIEINDILEKSEEEKELEDAMIDNLSNEIQSTIETYCKGNESSKILTESFKAKKTNITWFKRLKNQFKSLVYHKTHDYDTTWGSLNNTYIKIFKSPKKRFYKNSVNLIVSIDQSGSMRIEDLQRIFYLFKTEYKRIKKVNFLIHDAKIAKNIEINDLSSTNPSILIDAVGIRYVSGGTSHVDIFKYMESIKNIQEYIYVSFSDNCSDIEEQYPKYKNIKKINKFWINCHGDFLKEIPGHQYNI